MEFKDVNFTAVRAYNRLHTPLSNALEEAHHWDRQFDAGEWSDGFFAKFHDELEQKIATLVGARFGIEAEKLLEMVMFESYYSEDCFMRSVCIDNVSRC